MLPRIRLAFLVVAATVIGYALGSSQGGGVVTDFSHMVGLAWNHERLVRSGSTGGVPALLVSGFLIGQGLFLLARRFFGRIGANRAKRMEELATWDPAVQLSTRFGLHLYLEQCARWSAEDPTTRLQSLALFKVRGLGTLNGKRRTLVATELLQRIATELRLASLPDGTSTIRRLLVQYFPGPQSRWRTRVPQARVSARWSGATFALAFRELDATQVTTIARGVTSWIRRELASIQEGAELSVVTSVAIGTAGVYGRELAQVATRAIDGAVGEDVVIAIDEGDSRGKAIEGQSGVTVRRIAMHQSETESPGSLDPVYFMERLVVWLRLWGPGGTCLLGALVVLGFSGGKALPNPVFPWPESLGQLQIVDRNGPRTVNIVRQLLTPTETAFWRISDAVVVQGNPRDGAYSFCQIRLTLTNRSNRTTYVSVYDFTAIDTAGRKWEIDPTRALRVDKGITGRWLNPGESWTGWLIVARGEKAITGLLFEPDPSTSIQLRTLE